MIARSACVVAVLIAAATAVWFSGALQAPPRLKGRWKADRDGLEYKVHFFQGQEVGKGVLKGHFSERISSGYRGAGEYELRMMDDHEGTIALFNHSSGTVVGAVHLGNRRMELGKVVYVHQ